ncbi:glycosyltransferase [Methylosinus sp. KRF6]|nr:glycosyltransferase [Methylosinus sp. KRF6]MBU3889573.1 glycosyltransferase [Methylosinus sp. KRF6]
MMRHRAGASAPQTAAMKIEASPRGVDKTRPVVLALLEVLWPGNDATGPNQSFLELCRSLGDEFVFKAVARDRPFGSTLAVAPVGVWFEREFAKVRYCPVSVFGAAGLAEILRTTSYDVLMMNGFFDRDFTIPALTLRRFGRVPQRPTILSPRGEFSRGALALNSGRKHCYLALARRLGLLEDVWLHATGPCEAEDIARAFPHGRGIFVAPNVRRPTPAPAVRTVAKREGTLRLAFLGRVARVKNLDYALRVLRSVERPVSFDIFGPLQDGDYLRECLAIAADLPGHISVAFKGEIRNELVSQTLADCDLFFLPTRGENFGHAILDALLAGVPVLISDRTPFQSLELKGAGWSLSLDAPERFAEAIEAFAAMSPEKAATMRAAARELGERSILESDAVAANRAMLHSALGHMR